MNNYTISDINNSQNKKWKQLWQLDNKYLVIIHKSIIQKLGITENSTIFLKQEITSDNAIRMRIKKF